MSIRTPWGARRRGWRAATPNTPADPATILAGPLDPALEAIRADLRPHGRRLWLRRIVRRAFLVGGVVAVAEVALFAAARVLPIEILTSLAMAIPVVGAVALVVWSASDSQSLFLEQVATSWLHRR